MAVDAQHDQGQADGTQHRQHERDDATAGQRSQDANGRTVGMQQCEKKHDAQDVRHLSLIHI